jgi:hypothetical protein
MQFDTATGQLSGVVTGSGVHPVVFECTDAWGAVATASLTVDAAAGVNLSRRGLTEKAPLGSTHGQYLTRYLELTAGTSLTVTMSGGGANKTRPQLALVDSAGAPADIAAWTKSTANSVRLKSFPVPRTGRWFLRATAAPGYAGKVKLSYSISPRTVWTSSATAGPATSPEYAFSAPPGARLSIVAQSPKGSSALPRIVAVVAPDGSDLLPGGVVSESGTKATFTTKTPLAGGDHQVRFAARDANEGPISWTVRLRLPKSYTFAMPEVAAGE